MLLQSQDVHGVSVVLLLCQRLEDGQEIGCDGLLLHEAVLSLFDKVVGQEVISCLISDAALHDQARDRGEKDWAVITGLTF